ncbi:MAG: Fic family protein [Bacteroidia bacterium]|nr:Fic family protein [Bacteroidia bacterium]MBP7714760.1 Fic family protein [Bacteroidia bacterium]MBP8669293.1 Fic family protein [Bacteroidia bacterium]HQW16581.1 Fic family protein [Bacteroidia bacterium]HQW47983.1 Fic family protein [Bacteroidia bacterium]
MKLKIIKDNLLKAYLGQVPKGLQKAFDNLQDAELSTPNFSFYTSVATVFSSKIEGESIELDSYIKHRRDGISFQPDYTKKIDDLYNAYLFAQENKLNEQNVKQAHAILSKHIVTNEWQGRYWQQNMYVTSEDGRIEYVAALPQIVEDEILKLFEDIDLLIKTNLSLGKVFYYAAMIHLVFVKIHPWNDGNGRSARLIEKWFLSEKLGAKAWFMQSEKMYYSRHSEYYNCLRQLGLEYENLNYQKALPFVLMLPDCV